MRISLNQGQRHQIARVAFTLAPVAREVFLHDTQCAIDQRCRGRAPTNSDVEAAIEDTLSAILPKTTYLCDAVSTTKEAHMSNIFDEDDESFETVYVDGKRTRVLRDGCVLRTSLMAMDGGPEILLNAAKHLEQQCSKRAHAAHDESMFSDADRQRAREFGLDDAGAMFRPGYRHAPKSAVTRDALVKAYADYTCDLETAYMNPNNNEKTGFGSHGPVDKTGQGQVGQSCTVRNLHFPDHTGERGTLQRIGGEIVCAPDDYDAYDGMSDREAAHREYHDHLVNAWRHPNGDVAEDRVPAVMQRDDVSTKDAATVQKDHAANMDRIYADRDRELSEAWRGGR